MTEVVVHPFDDAQVFLEQVIGRAFGIIREFPEPQRYAKTGDAWLSALREAFWERYEPLSRSDEDGRPRLAAFGGKPPVDASDRRNPSGIDPWRRWEFMYDVSVVQLEWIPAAYQPSHVPILKRVLWQVESEMALDGTKVAEDLSKLKAGLADYKLLVVACPKQRDPSHWQTFIERAAEGITGTAYVVEIPTYAGTTTEAWGRLDKSGVQVRRLGGRSSDSRPSVSVDQIEP